MNKRTKRDLQNAWILTLMAGVLGFLISIAANALYDFMIGPEPIHVIICTIFVVLSIFWGGLLSFTIDKGGEEKYKKMKTFEFIWEYCRSMARRVFK